MENGRVTAAAALTRTLVRSAEDAESLEGNS